MQCCAWQHAADQNGCDTVDKPVGTRKGQPEVSLEEQGGSAKAEWQAHLVVACQLRDVVCKMFVKKVQWHLIMPSTAVSQEVVKAHVVVPCNGLLLAKGYLQVLGVPLLQRRPIIHLHGDCQLKGHIKGTH